MDKRLAMVGLGIMTCLVLSGCVHGSQYAGWDLQISKGKYKDCLKTYPNDESKCEGLRKLYEIDRDTVESYKSIIRR